MGQLQLWQRWRRLSLQGKVGVFIGIWTCCTLSVRYCIELKKRPNARRYLYDHCPWALDSFYSMTNFFSGLRGRTPGMGDRIREQDMYTWRLEDEPPLRGEDEQLGIMATREKRPRYQR